jgi:hypothetical protein
VGSEKLQPPPDVFAKGKLDKVVIAGGVGKLGQRPVDFGEGGVARDLL